MKKLLAIVLTAVMVISLTTGVMAAPPPKDKPAQVDFGGTMTVHVGDSVTLTATTLKQGSSIKDSWDGAAAIETKLVENADGVGYYVATATFDTSTAGTYVVTYSITMDAGKSGVAFVGSGSMTIIVLPAERSVVSFKPAEWYFHNQGDTHGNNPNQDDSYQLVVTKLEVTYNDGTTETVSVTGEDFVVGGFGSDRTSHPFTLTYGGVTEEFTL